MTSSKSCNKNWGKTGYQENILELTSGDNDATQCTIGWLVCLGVNILIFIYFSVYFFQLFSIVLHTIFNIISEFFTMYIFLLLSLCKLSSNAAVCMHYM